MNNSYDRLMNMLSSVKTSGFEYGTGNMASMSPGPKGDSVRKALSDPLGNFLRGWTPTTDPLERMIAHRDPRAGLVEFLNGRVNHVVPRETNPIAGNLAAAKPATSKAILPKTPMKPGGKKASLFPQEINPEELLAGLSAVRAAMGLKQPSINPVTSKDQFPKGMVPPPVGSPMAASVGQQIPIPPPPAGSPMAEHVSPKLLNKKSSATDALQRLMKAAGLIPGLPDGSGPRGRGMGPGGGEASGAGLEALKGILQQNISPETLQLLSILALAKQRTDAGGAQGILDALSGPQQDIPKESSVKKKPDTTPDNALGALTEALAQAYKTTPQVGPFSLFPDLPQTEKKPQAPENHNISKKSSARPEWVSRWLGKSASQPQGLVDGLRQSMADMFTDKEGGAGATAAQTATNALANRRAQTEAAISGASGGTPPATSTMGNMAANIRAGVLRRFSNMGVGPRVQAHARGTGFINRLSPGVMRSAINSVYPTSADINAMIGR